MCLGFDLHSRVQVLLFVACVVPPFSCLYCLAILQVRKQTKSSPQNPVTLYNIQDNPGARPKRVRVGRGPGSKLGKSAGRGMCGKRAREGGVRSNVFIGGQTPLHRAMPHVGFKNPNKIDYQVINLDKLADAIARGRIKRCVAASTRALVPQVLRTFSLTVFAPHHLVSIFLFFLLFLPPLLFFLSGLLPRMHLLMGR